MTNSLQSQDATSDCFSGIFRRLLCSGALPTHPSDVIAAESTHQTQFNHPEKDSKTEPKPHSSAPTPGIVARLMGLDSLPETNWAPKRRTLESILRSRSVNSLNYIPQLDLNQGQHRRAKTSVSFREIPTFLHKPSHDFFVLCFEKAGDGNRMRLSVSKSEMGLQRFKHREVKKAEKNRGEDVREKEIEPKANYESKKEEPKRSFHGKCVCKVDEVCPQKKGDAYRQPREALKAKSAEKLMKNKEAKLSSSVSTFTKKKKKRNTQNSSPVSVHHVPNIAKPGEPRLPEKPRDPVSSSMSRTPGKGTDYYEYPRPNFSRTFTVDAEDLKAVRIKEDKPTKTRDVSHENHARLLDQICWLSEEHINDHDQSNWAFKKDVSFEEVEEICVEFGQQILDLVFQQVVDELN